MLVIHNEQLANRLQRIATRENRPIEDVLESLLADYPEEMPAAQTENAVQQYRAKLYLRSRQYWQQTGDVKRLALTDAELDEQFWLFDADDIPRLKADQDAVSLLPSSGAWLAKTVESVGLSDQVDIAGHADDILREEFADYLLKRMNDEDGAR